MTESRLYPNREKTPALYKWRATYADNNTINQYDPDYVKIEDLPRTKLRMFEILDEEQDVIFKLTLLPGDTFSYRCRSMIRAGKGLIARYYGVCFTRDKKTTLIWLTEKTKAIEIYRLEENEDISVNPTNEKEPNHSYIFSPVKNDEVEID